MNVKPAHERHDHEPAERRRSREPRRRSREHPDQGEPHEHQERDRGVGAGRGQRRVHPERHRRRREGGPKGDRGQGSGGNADALRPHVHLAAHAASLRHGATLASGPVGDSARGTGPASIPVATTHAWSKQPTTSVTRSVRCSRPPRVDVAIRPTGGQKRPARAPTSSNQPRAGRLIDDQRVSSRSRCRVPLGARSRPRPGPSVTWSGPGARRACRAVAQLEPAGAGLAPDPLSPRLHLGPGVLERHRPAEDRCARS